MKLKVRSLEVRTSPTGLMPSAKIFYVLYFTALIYYENNFLGVGGGFGGGGGVSGYNLFQNNGFNPYIFLIVSVYYKDK